VWEGSLGPNSFPEAMYEFPIESKSEFTNETPLRGYDNHKEEWPKCMHGEECLVQMCTDGVDGDHRFFKCPRALVNVTTNALLNMFLFFFTTNKRYLLQSSNAPENYGFVRWIDPPLIHPHAEYVYYMQNRIFNLQMEVSSGDKDEEEEDSSNGAGSQEALCTDPYCNCPCHRKNGPPPPPPPPPMMGGYSGEGTTLHCFLCGNSTRNNLSYSHATSMCLMFSLIT
jgi:hypothetical protein